MDISKEKILDFYLDAIKLKEIMRRGWLQKGLSSAESVADHTYGVCILSLLFATIYKLNVPKVLIMALIHDIPEINIGDITPLDNFPSGKKQILEEDEAKKIFSNIDDSNELFNLWMEFEYQLSEEGKLVKQIDKLEVAFQSFIYQKEKNINFDDFYSSVAECIDNKDLHYILDELQNRLTQIKQ